jgi:hypothetical protein
MFSSESQLEKLICDWLDCGVFLPMKSRDNVVSYERQKNLGYFGIPDLIIHREETHQKVMTRSIQVIELKLGYLKTVDIAQICKYKAYFDFNKEHYADIEFDYTIICKGNESLSMCKDKGFLLSQLPWLNVDCYSEDKHGRIKFEEAMGERHLIGF